ncbi:(-)-germacrene D synthase [Bienertia sinuspersici]
MGSVQAEDVVIRPLAHFPPDIWGNNFVTFTSEDSLMMERYAKEIEPMKEEVRKMLISMNSSDDLATQMSLIDAVERLGVSYYFENEIEELLDQIFEKHEAKNFEMDHDLYNTASQFRIFRQHGYKMPCDVFNKFTNDDGEIKETLKTDIRGMVSLYEAAHLRVHGDPLLDKAYAFASEALKSSAKFSEQARHALNQVLHFGIQRVESRHYISVYEQDESRNNTLLRFAKIDFNRVQLWWDDLDFKNKLPYARQRCVECHYWSIAMYYEPQYSLARMLLVKVLKAISLLDDTYDAYGTFEELKLLTQAFERWDLSAMEQLPAEYMKLVFQYVYNTYGEFAKEMTERGKPYAAKFAKDRVMDLIRSYYTEAKWYKAKYVPTFDEYMVNARITGVAQIITTSSLMGMEEIAEVKPFEQIIQAPKAIRACEVIGRIMDDIVSHEEEQARGHVASGVECYMKDYNKSREEVVEIFNKMVEDAWKELNKELLINKSNDNPSSDNDNDNYNDNNNRLPKPVLRRVLNLARVVDALYKVIDGYTYSAKLIKDDIISIYTQPFPI